MNQTIEHKRFLIAGDTHCIFSQTSYLIETAKKNNCTAVFVVGDFNYGYPFYKEYEDFVVQELSNNDMQLYFIDGNHENFNALFGMTFEKDSAGFSVVRKNIMYAERGLDWTWSGVKFLALGGACSLDRNSNKENIDWFADEIIRHKDIEKCFEAGKVDIMITHDCPQMTIPNFSIDKYDDLAGVLYNRRAIKEVCINAKPHMLFHGHLHHRHHTLLSIGVGRATLVNGLGAKTQDPDSWIVFDANEWRQDKHKTKPISYLSE